MNNKLTIDEALKLGIEAHKAGKSRKADRYYTAILKTEPKHPDANHNMGVLAVSVGKADDKYVKLGQRIVDRYDKNKDGQLTASEWGKMLMSPAAADGNRDGKITVQEYASWMQSRQKR